MQTNIQTYVEISVVLLIVSLAAYSLIRRFLMPKKVQQLACGGSGCSGSCSGCSMNQSAVKPNQLAALAVSPKNQRGIDHRTIAIVSMPEQSKEQ